MLPDNGLVGVIQVEVTLGKVPPFFLPSILFLFTSPSIALIFYTHSLLSYFRPLGSPDWILYKLSFLFYTLLSRAAAVAQLQDAHLACVRSEVQSIVLLEGPKRSHQLEISLSAQVQPILQVMARVTLARYKSGPASLQSSPTVRVQDRPFLLASRDQDGLAMPALSNTTHSQSLLAPGTMCPSCSHSILVRAQNTAQLYTLVTLYPCQSLHIYLMRKPCPGVQHGQLTVTSCLVPHFSIASIYAPFIRIIRPNEQRPCVCF